MRNIINNLNEWLLCNKDLIAIYVSILGAITVPIVLALWAIADQRRKERQETNRYEKEFLLNYIREEFKSPDIMQNGIVGSLGFYFQKFLALQHIIKNFSYSYMASDLGILISITGLVMSSNIDIGENIYI